MAKNLIFGLILIRLPQIWAPKCLTLMQATIAFNFTETL